MEFSKVFHIIINLKFLFFSFSITFKKSLKVLLIPETKNINKNIYTYLFLFQNLTNFGTHYSQLFTIIHNYSQLFTIIHNYYQLLSIYFEIIHNYLNTNTNTTTI